MKACHYYAFRDGYALGNIHAGDLASEEYPLLVNCAGNEVRNEPLSTCNQSGRSDYYLIYMECGSMEVTFPDGVRRVGAGDVILFPPAHPYQYRCIDSFPLSYLWVHFTGSYAHRLLEECGFDALPCTKKTTASPSLAVGFRRLFEVFETSGRLQRQELACTLERLLLNLAQSIGEEARECRLERALNRIHTAYSSELRIPELAKEEHLSNSRFIAVFKEWTGLSPNEYVINLRMSIACDQLRNSKRSVKEIALAVGYSDPHFFSKLFKRKTGLSPQQYRDGG